MSLVAGRKAVHFHLPCVSSNIIYDFSVFSSSNTTGNRVYLNLTSRLVSEVTDLDHEPFQVIRGGLLTPISEKNKQLKTAYVTDTRLMGVLAIHAHWYLPDEQERCDFHQFYYIDCEETGLETYRSLRTDDFLDISGELRDIEQSMIGGLGAKKIEIDEKQLAAIITFYSRFNDERGLPHPANHEEYSFLLDIGDTLDSYQREALMAAICGPIHSNYQVINYFLMRCFGQDYRAAKRLTAGDFPIDLYDRFTRTTFCKNVIDRTGERDDGTATYLCESLVEHDGRYEIIVSGLSVKNLRVTEFRYCSGFRVSAAEAAMKLAKPEFVTVYEVLLDEESIENNLGELTINFNSIMSRHETGRLFMAFKDSNAHVDSDQFMLSNDVNGIFYLTDFGQLIVAAYTLDEIRNMERRLKVSLLAPYLMTTAKYEFKEPILYEFIHSGFEDFEDFLDAIRE